MQPTDELYNSLQIAFEHFNQSLFDGGLPKVIFTVQRKRGVTGYFAAERWGSLEGEKCHEIAINPSYIANYRLIEVMQTLVHEMVHCWQCCFGKPGRKGYHNIEWARKMIKVGLMPSSTGEPGGNIVGQHMADYILEDGQFLIAFNDLKDNQNFQLSWIDRLAMPRLFKPIIATKDAKGVVREPSFEGPFEIRQENSNIETPDNLISEGSDQSNTPYVLEYDDKSYLDTMPGSFFENQPVYAKKSRHRYVCKCVTRVYGKPGLEITCKKCGHDFEWVEYENKKDP